MWLNFTSGTIQVPFGAGWGGLNSAGPVPHPWIAGGRWEYLVQLGFCQRVVSPPWGESLHGACISMEMWLFPVEQIHYTSEVRDFLHWPISSFLVWIQLVWVLFFRYPAVIIWICQDFILDLIVCLLCFTVSLRMGINIVKRPWYGTEGYLGPVWPWSSHLSSLRPFLIDTVVLIGLINASCSEDQLK
jgi:hypothetical protein